MPVLRRTLPRRNRRIPLSTFFPIPTEGSAAPRDLLLYNARLVDRDLDASGAVLVRGGKICAVYAGNEPSAGYSGALASLRADPSVDSVDARGAVLMPAFVDLHAHFRDPGYTQKEDVISGSKAAASGGYGTVVLMANTDPPISTEKDALGVVARVRAEGLIDAFQAVTLTRNFDGADTRELLSLDRALVPIASEDGREVASAAVMLRAMEACAKTGVIVSCHCEDSELALAAKPFRSAALEAARAEGLAPGCLAAPGKAVSPEVRANVAEAERLLALAEDAMTERNLILARAAGCRVHLAHVSTRGAIDAVRRAKEAVLPGGGFRVTCEVTPHHLALNHDAPEIVNPPLRGEADREALIGGILDGTVDAIATDHAPHTVDDKASGAPGFSGIEIAAATVYTALVKSGRIGLRRFSALMSANPASLLCLSRGLLRAGYDADLVLFEPEAVFTVDPESSQWHSRGKNTPLAGQSLSGTVVATFKRGHVVYEREQDCIVFG